MKRTLQVAGSLTLPLDFVTQTTVVLGKKGVGKTSLCSVIAEELLDCGQQVVLIDPLDVLWGLRSSEDGKSPGYPITVLGGNHADLPLVPDAGAAIARFVVEKQASVILSLRKFSMGEQRRFLIPFLQTMFDMKGEDRYKTPMQLIVDEAAEYLPQVIRGNSENVAVLFDVFDRVIRLGRSSGIGILLNSQRSAKINKDSIGMLDTLIVMRTLAPLDRKAVEAWVEAHDLFDQAGPCLDSLASLKTGEAWVWSPEALDLFKRVQFRRRNTFDSSATPKAGPAPKPKVLAPVDLIVLEGQIGEAVATIKANDPSSLKARIRALEAELKKKSALPAAEDNPEALKRARDRGANEVRKLMAGEVNSLRHAASQLKRHITKILENVNQGFSQANGELVTAFAAVNAIQLPAVRELLSIVDEVVQAPVQTRPSVPQRVEKPIPAHGLNPQPRRQPGHSNGIGSLSKAESAVLSAMASRAPKSCTRSQLSILSGYSIKSSGFANTLSTLRTKGYANGLGDSISITGEGVNALGESFRPPPTGRALLEQWLGKLGKCERTLLESLIENRDGLNADELAEVSGYSRTSSGFANACSILRSLELAQQGWPMKPSEDLFE